MTLISAPPAGRPTPTGPVAASMPEQPGAFASILRGIGAQTAEREDVAATGAGQDPAASAPTTPLSVPATPPYGLSVVPPTAAATAVSTVDSSTDAGMMAAGDSAASPVQATTMPDSPGARDDVPSSDSADVSAGLDTTTEVPATGQSDPIAGHPSAGLSIPNSPQATGTGAGAGQVPADAPQTAPVRPAQIASAQPGARVPGDVPGTPVEGGTPEKSGIRAPRSSAPTAAFPTGVTVPADSASSPAFQPSGVPANVPAPPVAHRQQSAADAAGLVPVAAGAATTLPTPAAVTAPPAAAHAPSQAPAQPLSTQLAQPLFSLAGARPGEHVMTVQVTPENLGPVTVRAVIGADDIRIELFSPSEGGRDALRQILTDLRRDLAGGGLSASLDLSSRNEAGDREERTPLREAPRSPAAAPEPVGEQRAAPASTATTTLDVTV